MVIIVCVNIVVIRVIGVKCQIIKRWVCPMGTQLFLFDYKTYVSIAVVLLLVKCYDKKKPGRPLTTFTLCFLWTSAGQQQQQKKSKTILNFSLVGGPLVGLC